MTSVFLTYDAIAVAAWLLALLIIKPRNAIDLSRCAGWYLLVFLATYVVRPSLSEITSDFWLYSWLKLGSPEEHWQVMAVAVTLAILSFAVGYAWGAPSPAAVRAAATAPPEPRIDPKLVKALIFSILTLGYIAAVFSIRYGNGAGALNTGDASLGIYEHNTAWFVHDDLLISGATVLYYILTGRLVMSLVLAAPWIMIRTLSGWGRTNLIGHFFALTAVYFLKRRQVKRTGKSSNQALAIGVGTVVVLALFPLMGMLRTLKAGLGIKSLFSKDAIMMVSSKTDPEDMIQSYFGTNSPVAGFELTMSHLVYDPRSELGTQYLYYYVFQPVPRIIWPGKGTPYSWPEELRGVAVDPLLGLICAAPGSIGMAYSQWGWLGIPLEFILTGLIFRKAEEAARRRPQALHIQLGYAGLYSLLPQLGRDSLFLMISNFWLFKFGIPVFFLWRMHKSAQRSQFRKTVAVPAAALGALAPGASS
jgi:hypothetical protein